jgi:hypothetical protein
MNSILFDVNEESNLPITVTVTDSAGVAATPTAFNWSLSTRDGTIVNSRTNVSETPASTVVVTLAADDLQILDQTNDREYRLFTVETDEGDADIPVKMQLEFWVKNLKVVT